MVCVVIADLKREVKTTKKQKLQYANCVSRLSTGPSGETCLALRKAKKSYYMSLVSLPSANRHEMDYEFKSRSEDLNITEKRKSSNP